MPLAPCYSLVFALVGALPVAAASSKPVCGRIVALQCDPGPVEVLLDVGPLQDPTRMQFSAELSDGDRETAFGLLGQEVCAALPGKSGRDLVVTLSGVGDLQLKKQRTSQPPLPVGVFRACAPDVVAPRLLKVGQFRTPREALGLELHGTIVAELLVGVDGGVQSVRIVRGLQPPGIDGAVATDLRQWRYVPGTRLGQPVPVVVFVRYTLDMQMR